jgi:hypothetical protein
MITLPDVKEGRVSLSDIAEINHYLDMKNDIEYMAQDKAMKEAKNKRGWR